MQQKIAWDDVADKFNTYKKDVWLGAADNIATLWPVILDFIKKEIPTTKGLRALEFGCGTGMFCNELFKLGFNTTGIDLSPKMIKIAKENLNRKINVLAGDTKTAKDIALMDGKFNLITAQMVLQFITEKELHDIADSIEVNGYLIFANHNPENLKARGFTDTFTLSDTNTKVSIYIRLSEIYDKIFSSLGFKKLLEIYPETDNEILIKNKFTRPGNVPKYIVLAYQKI